jgi:hypothetical protein
MPRNPAMSDMEVFERGDIYAVLDYGGFDNDKKNVETLCDKLESENPGIRFDWHFEGGRVVIQSLDEAKERRLYETLKKIYDADA